MTYRELLIECDKKHIERESLILLVTERLNITNSMFILSLDKDIDSMLLKDITLLFNGTPVQYILGYAYFYEYKFKVTKDTLIPRFDTEVLVEEAINLLKKKKDAKVIDIGTGSGCIAISLKKQIPSLDMTALDISSKALEVAKENAKNNDVDIKFVLNDLLNGIDTKFDFIISNPPYIDESEDIMDLVKNNEPHLALYSPNKGLYHYEQILIMSKHNLNKDGIIIFEIPDHRDDEIISLVTKYYKNYTIKKDYNNLSRVLIIRS